MSFVPSDYLVHVVIDQFHDPVMVLGGLVTHSPALHKRVGIKVYFDGLNTLSVHPCRQDQRLGSIVVAAYAMVHCYAFLLDFHGGGDNLDVYLSVLEYHAEELLPICTEDWFVLGLPEVYGEEAY